MHCKNTKKDNALLSQIYESSCTRIGHCQQSKINHDTFKSKMPCLVQDGLMD